MTDTPDLPTLEALEARLAAVPGLAADALEAEAVALLGRKGGALTLLLRALPALELEERRRQGPLLNDLRVRLEAAIEARRRALSQAAATTTDDLTMPARRPWEGSLHPITLVMREVGAIFRGLGFTVATGPEAEDEWYNFTALNFPPDHPAMDMHDTFYLAGAPVERAGGRWLMRTHTSPVQIRVMQAGPPPYRVIIPGMCYRMDPFDASHAPAFHQVEGLAVDEGIGFVDLKATLTHFARALFGSDTRVRFRPSFFPFTEPSAEMDVSCGVCGGKGCPACKGTGWMEILGCGMVHPNVLQHAGVDSERYTGWAFGMGPGRIAMNRFGIPDIRLLYEGDMRFLGQFGGGAR